MEKKLIDNRKEEIIDACEKLYREIEFKNVNIKLLNKTEDQATKIAFTFFLFMIGIYPYSAVTKKQKQALKELDFKYEYYNIEELIKMGLQNIY